MATIFQGERIANVLTVQDDSTGNLTPTNFYQVPAGRWAVVKMVSAGFSSAKNGANLEVGIMSFPTFYNGGGGLGTSASFNMAGVVLANGATNDSVGFLGPVIVELTTGQLVRDNAAAGSGGIAVNFTVKEYFNP